MFIIPRNINDIKYGEPYFITLRIDLKKEKSSVNHTVWNYIF